MMCLRFRVADMAQGQHGQLCQDLCACQILPVFKFTPSCPVDQRPLHLFHPNTCHQKALETFFPMILTSRRLLAIVAGSPGAM
jgi:hypothetical protein